MGNARMPVLALILFAGPFFIAPHARDLQATFPPQGSLDAARIADILGGHRVPETTLNTLWFGSGAAPRAMPEATTRLTAALGPRPRQCTSLEV
ncbi:hypothetical protein CLG85_014205 [Yangia mangrovi]|uniref:Uncharacterized protein n=2 Tax=Alloyangia mangrovi TaxID=1779329 RepID=A0ABT2KPW6_9RHOB|nr:hypothetical protein [Alloyangia mangrovi]MCT4371412.1 hypothetical protein [Alloyangia mangrovi]